jgi:hypothetical protein
MLDNLIEKHKAKDIDEVVYKLSYSGKFIIVKGKTLAGSLIIINNTYLQYTKDNNRFKGHLYKHLYDHYNDNPSGRFRIKVLAKTDKKIDQYKLLKREQMELDRLRYDPSCLNNELEAYIPLYNELADTYGWLNKSAVMNFKRYLSSKERQAYIKRYSKKPAPGPASCDP